MNHFNVARHQVEQEGSKQCAVIYRDSMNYFVSHSTVVGICVGTDWYFTEEKHSVTTSKQVSQFSASKSFLPQDAFDSALSSGSYGLAKSVIESYEEKQAVLTKQQTDFTEYYYNGMHNNEVSLHLVILAAQLLEQQGKAVFNRITREVKAELIGALVDYEAGSDSKEKRYNKFKAKFNKALKG